MVLEITGKQARVCWSVIRACRAPQRCFCGSTINITAVVRRYA
ncbi:hypothetical protein HMPREF3190_00253 [Umbribacter vaginalis]|nr:hypothetical protein HMPREF3190_00253 [Coriobacteriales bacterium DNF00809]